MQFNWKKLHQMVRVTRTLLHCKEKKEHIEKSGPQWDIFAFSTMKNWTDDSETRPQWFWPILSPVTSLFLKLNKGKFYQASQ